MNILIIGYAESIDKMLTMLSEKYFESEEDVVEVCDWCNSREITELLADAERYDCYVVAAYNRASSGEICTILNRAYGISNEKILNYHDMYDITMPFMKVDRMMMGQNRNFKGMILGISHSEVGIVPELFDEPFVNLSVSSQDLYYNLKTLEYCIKNYPERILGLKYLIIDMFDYTYFNYDVSKSKTIVTYISAHGFINCEHNFALNKNYDIDYHDFLPYVLSRYYEGISESKIDTFKKLFGDIHEKDNYKGFSVSEQLCERNRIVTEDDVINYVVDKSIVKNRYEDTIHENVSIFHKIIEMVKAINPDIRIICMLMPRYAKAQEKAAEAYKDWKKEFYEIIETAQQKYDFEFWDMKEIPISQRTEYYMDISHFNYAGALAFTKMLNELIYGNVNK